MSKTEIKIGIAGLGTVGQGVIQIIEQNRETLKNKTGMDFTIKAVNARSKHKNRDVDISRYDWEDHTLDLASREDIDIFVELIGGEDGEVKESIEKALGSGKHVVTANKALLAKHGQKLAMLADSQNGMLRYEAAVAGGIPIIKALGEGLAGNQITRVSGIMNGTCNYMLSRMELENISYEEVFDAANQLGYLEADPSLDVGGIDAAHKLAILASLAFGQQVNLDAINILGIENVSLRDIELARELGYRIKLVGEAEKTDNGVSTRVAPMLVSLESPLGQCMGVTNIVVVEGDAVGKCVLQGPGAGRGPTASAVVGDICDIVRGLDMPTFGQKAETLAPTVAVKSSLESPFYVRMKLNDTVGVLAKVTACFAEAGISIDEMRQLDHEGSETPLILITHQTEQSSLNQVLAKVNDMDEVLQAPVAFRISNS